MRKFLSLAFVLILTFSMLTGCEETVAPSGPASNLKISQALHDAHGTKSFAVATVVTDGTKIYRAHLDEFQYVAKEGNVGVPNSDSDFGAFVADQTRVLGSKKVNDASYSAGMAKSGGATQSLGKSYTAIELFAEGKTIAELEAAIAGKEAAAVIDVVSGSTLTDTKGYIETIILAAKNYGTDSSPTFSVKDVANLHLGRAYHAAHGTKAFASGTVAMEGDKIVGAYLDEFQYQAKASVIGVPNADKDFGGFVADETRALASKKVNNDTYSANMATSAGSTQPLMKSYNAIEAFAQGKTIAELEGTIAGKEPAAVIDVVSGSTLADTKGYLETLIMAGKNVNGSKKTNLKISQALHAAHGTKAFAVATVVTDGTKIYRANLDEFQYVAKADYVGVPNSNSDFGDFVADKTRVLASKKENDAAYSAGMAKSGGATQPLGKSYAAIEAFAEGKTIAELEGAIAGKESAAVIDVVSGSTLTDTKGYIETIIMAAKNYSSDSSPVFAANHPANLKIGRAYHAAHGTKAFASATVAMEGGKVVGAYLDEFQYQAKASVTGVPNADKDFGTAVADATRALASKKVNNESYSANMAKSGGATQPLMKSYNAIEAFALGKTIAQLEGSIAGKEPAAVIDVVSGSTLADTKGYLETIIFAAAQAK